MTALTAAVVSSGAKSLPAANGATAAPRVHSPIAVTSHHLVYASCPCSAARIESRSPTKGDRLPLTTSPPGNHLGVAVEAGEQLAVFKR